MKDKEIREVQGMDELKEVIAELPESNLVGTIGGIQNTVSNIAGIVAPIFTGYIIYVTGGFKIALLVSSIISCIGAFSYIFIVGKLETINIED